MQIDIVVIYPRATGNIEAGKADNVTRIEKQDSFTRAAVFWKWREMTALE